MGLEGIVSKRIGSRYVSGPGAIRRANNAKSKIPSRVEHVFAAQKDRMDLFIRTIWIARATTKIGMANLVYNIKRLKCGR
jgi:transposase, IS5 family